MFNKEIWNYFEDIIDCPSSYQKIQEPLKEDVFWNYVPSTYINGFINFVEPVEMFLLDRYTKTLDQDGDAYTMKKEHLKYAIEEEYDHVHTHLNMFRDDIILLTKLENDDVKYDENPDAQYTYILFWSDCDCSDCGIGKFVTKDSIEEIVKSITNWLDRVCLENKGSLLADITGYTKLHVNYLRGWITF